MRCRDVEKALLGAAAGTDLTRHLSECEECARLAERLDVAKRLLREERLVVAPDPDFSRRVMARLPDREPALGWAAARLLPAAAALLLALAVWAWTGSAPASELFTSAPTDDLVTWVLQNGDSSE